MGPRSARVGPRAYGNLTYGALPWLLVLARSLLLAVLLSLAFASPAAAESWLPHPGGRHVDLRVDGQRLQPDADEGEGDGQGATGELLHARLDDEEEGNPRTRSSASATSRSWRRPPASSTPTGRATRRRPSFPVLCAARRAAATASPARTTTSSGARGARRSRRRSLDGASGRAPAARGNDIDELSRLRRPEQVTVPAFGQPVQAAKVRTRDHAGRRARRSLRQRRPHRLVGLGCRPVKVVFEHAGGANAPVTTARPPRDEPDAEARAGRRELLPARQGRHHDVPLDELAPPQEAVGPAGHGREVGERSAQLAVKSVSGPDQGRGRLRLHLPCRRAHEHLARRQLGVARELPAARPEGAAAATSAGASSTPFDLMNFGFNPSLRAYPRPAQSWEGRVSGRDFAVYGVTGTPRSGRPTVKVPAARSARSRCGRC